ncbi:unnamed protein product [Adineta ricciae]|uniref:Aprataxin and PNK-like factor n=1 Tax=Adineta ricciae TaxID=249248 RepID=A0A814KXP7_ADIRI|nr:unnamed protein product [Adineta ricciae]CAF1317880.1 unnamed protein product [Adineta ricciae]
MSIVELIPLNKGNRVVLNDTNLIIIGRSPTIGCLDNKISRNHAQLWLQPDGSLWIKAIHHNPTFYKTKANQIVRLTKNKKYQLHQDDQFGLLPDEFFYQVSIKPQNETTEKENQALKTDTHSDDGKSQLESDTNAIVVSDPIPDSSQSITKIDEKESSEDKLTTTPHIRSRIYPGEKKASALVYDDDTDEESDLRPSSSEPKLVTAVNNGSSSTAVASGSVDPKQRDRCPYGASCYRKNLLHRQEASHTGDPDWEVKDEESKTTKPDCPYGRECYRTNTDHLKEYNHPKKKCIELNTKSRSTKRKIDDEDDDDDDGLPNEYNYNDSFIDDQDLDSDSTNAEEDSVKSDGDIEWKPEKHARDFDDTDDASSDESERELRNHEAERFIKHSSTTDDESVNKKPRIQNDSADDTD